MPVVLGRRGTHGCSGDKPWPLLNAATGKVEACSGPTREQALKALQARNMAHAGLLKVAKTALCHWHQLVVSVLKQRGFYHITPLALPDNEEGERREATTHTSTSKAYAGRIVKADEARQIVYGIVMEPADPEAVKKWVEEGKKGDPPEGVDTEGDWVFAEDIEAAAHEFMRLYREQTNLKLNHRGKPIEAAIVESYIAPVDYGEGEARVRAGSWVMAAKLAAPHWELVTKGELTGFSIGGVGERVEE